MKKILLLLLSSLKLIANDGGYLFVTFKNGDDRMSEQIYFALSKDGRHWEALNKEKPVLVSKVGDRGVRDPFVLRTQDGKGFVIIATDLSMSRTRDWGKAQTKGSKSVVIWTSRDLVNWSKPLLAKVAPDDAGCTWAPEAVYDEQAKDYMVFWASKTKNDNYDKHRIWAAHTKDFKNFSEPFIYIEKPTTIIDTTIVRENGKYYRFTKDERDKAITMESCGTLNGQWQELSSFTLSQLRGYEGPSCYVVEKAQGDKPSSWCLILDQYSKGTGYQPFVTTDLSTGNFVEGEGFEFPFHFRHGSVLPISDAEYKKLEAAYK